MQWQIEDDSWKIVPIRKDICEFSFWLCGVAVVLQTQTLLYKILRIDAMLCLYAYGKMSADKKRQYKKGVEKIKTTPCPKENNKQTNNCP